MSCEALGLLGAERPFAATDENPATNLVRDGRKYADLRLPWTGRVQWTEF
jgi:hypothetical protein